MARAAWREKRDDYTESVARKVAIIRQRKGMTYAEFGELVGRTAATVRRWERSGGMRGVTTSRLLVIADRTGVSLDWLFSPDDPCRFPVMRDGTVMPPPLRIVGGKPNPDPIRPDPEPAIRDPLDAVDSDDPDERRAAAKALMAGFTDRQCKALLHALRRAKVASALGGSLRLFERILWREYHAHLAGCRAAPGDGDVVPIAR